MYSICTKRGCAHRWTQCGSTLKCACLPAGVINVNDLLAVLGDYGKTSGIDSTDSNGDVRRVPRILIFLDSAASFLSPPATIYRST